MANCNGCTQTWTGLKYAHCASCHETFSTVGNFDRHRRSGVCISPQGCGMTRTHTSVWVDAKKRSDSSC